jgi:methionyl-tRNA synthetase
MMNLARIGNKFLAETEPWKLSKTDMDAVGHILNLAISIVGNIALACEPFLPGTSKQIKKQLNILSNGSDFWTTEKIIEEIPAGHLLNKPELLFQNIEDTDIERQVQKLKKETVMTDHEKSLAPLKPEIVFDDFAKLDIRIGRVLAAERMEKSKKLLKLTVDTGIDQRTILSGIAEHFSPEEMVGKQVSLIANLAQRKMMGIESQGMILMADDAQGNLRLIQPSEVVPPGSQVS